MLCLGQVVVSVKSHWGEDRPDVPPPLLYLLVGLVGVVGEKSYTLQDIPCKSLMPALRPARCICSEVPDILGIAQSSLFVEPPGLRQHLVGLVFLVAIRVAVIEQPLGQVPNFIVGCIWIARQLPVGHVQVVAAGQPHGLEPSGLLRGQLALRFEELECV